MVEKINQYEINLSNIDGLLIGTDSLKLIEFTKKHIFSYEKGDLLDIGSGTGILTFSLANLENIDTIYSVEIQENIFNILQENIKNNGLDDKIKALNMDINDFNKKVKYIISNPPYYKINSGKLPKTESMKISKFEFKLNMENLFKKVFEILDIDGSFFVIYPIDRINDLNKFQKKYNFITKNEEIFGKNKKFIIKEYTRLK